MSITRSVSMAIDAVTLSAAGLRAQYRVPERRSDPPEPRDLEREQRDRDTLAEERADEARADEPSAAEVIETLRVLLPYLPAIVDAVDPQQHAALLRARALLARRPR